MEAGWEMASRAGPAARMRAVVELHEELADCEADLDALMQRAADGSAAVLGAVAGLFVLDNDAAVRRSHAHPEPARHRLLQQVDGALEQGLHELVDTVIRAGHVVRVDPDDVGQLLAGTDGPYAEYYETY